MQAGNKLINNDNIFIMLGALGTPENNAVWAQQQPKGVPNIFPFTAARSMHEPFHALKFAQFSTYYDQVRAAVKHFVEKEGKQKVCSMYVDNDFGHEIRDGVRDQAKAHKLKVVAEEAYGPLDTEFVAPITKLKIGGLRPCRHGLHHRRHHPVRRHRQEARLDRRDLRRPGGLLRPDRGWRARRHNGRLLLRHRHALRLCRHQLAMRSRRGRPNTRPGPARTPTAAAQYAYVGADIVIKALEAAGKDLTRAKFIAALESIKDYRPMFPGPTLNYGAKQRQGSTPRSSPGSKAAAGR